MKCLSIALIFAITVTANSQSLECIENINISLQNDCQAMVSSFDLLTGNFEGLTEADFTIIIDGINVGQTATVEGAGSYAFTVSCATGANCGSFTSCSGIFETQDNTVPSCITPPNQTVLCSELPAGINWMNVSLEALDSLFGEATAIDNCPGAEVLNLPYIANVDECNAGTITRRFRAIDGSNNITPTCQQIVTILNEDNYSITADIKNTYCPDSADCSAKVTIPIEVSRCCPDGSGTLEAFYIGDNDTRIQASVTGTYPSFETDTSLLAGTYEMEFLFVDGAGDSSFQQRSFQVLACASPSCPNLTGDGSIGGQLRSVNGQPVGNVEILLQGPGNWQNITDVDGRYLFSNLPVGAAYTIRPQAGTFEISSPPIDLSPILLHVYGVELLETPFQLIAADVNRSNAVTLADYALLLQAQEQPQEGNNLSAYRFVPASVTFISNSNPWITPLPEMIIIDDLPQDGLLELDFTVIEIGNTQP